MFFCGCCSVFSCFVSRFFYFSEFVLESVDCCFFSCFLIFFRTLENFSEVFSFFIARIATFRSSPLRSIPGLFNDNGGVLRDFSQ